MSTETKQATGGFLGDPDEALNPPASAGGCCGGPATTLTGTVEPAQASTCCGTAEQAEAEGACCGAAAKEQAVASGAGCCG